MALDSFKEDLSNILEINIDDLHDDFEFDSDNWNSLSIVATIVAIDEHFAIQIEGDKLKSCHNVLDLLQLISNSIQMYDKL